MNSVCKILIVDDESILRNGLKYICNWEEEGFTIVGEAENGQEALEYIDKLQPHIVITDVVMPVLDGVELSKIIEKRYPNIKVLILSSFGDFDYIKETFKHGVYDYLLKPKVSTQTILPILKKMSMEFDITQFDNTTDLNSELEEELVRVINSDINSVYESTLLSNYFSKGKLVIMKASINSLIKKYSYSNLNAKRELNNICKETIDNYRYITAINNNQYVIVINVDDENEGKTLLDLKGLAKKIKINFNSMTFIISNIIDNIHMLQEKSSTISEFVDKAFYFNKAHIINEDEFKIKVDNTRFKYDLYNANLIGLNFETCKSIVGSYFQEVRSNLSLDEYSFKKFCQNIIYNTLNTIDELNIDISDINKNKMKIFKYIDLEDKFDEITKIVMVFLDELSTIITLQNSNKSTIVNKVKQYVEENYQKDLSLADISKALHMDYYYLSYYFKNHTNENLSIYINRVRIEKAKVFLADNKIPISKISEMVGFAEHNYFSKIFKKYTNVTPSEYRKRLFK